MARPRRATRLGPVALALAMTACASRPFVRADRPPWQGAIAPAAGDVAVRLLLLGDGGVDRDSPALELVRREAARLPARTAVVFTGDNVYRRGVPHPKEVGCRQEREKAARVLGRQVDAVVQAGARGIFVPGNHDWGYGDARGLDRVEAAADLVGHLAGDGDVVQLPEPGCPGPAVVDVGEVVRLVLIDTEWSLRSGPRREEGCAWGNPVRPKRDTFRSLAEVEARLLEVIDGAGARRVIAIGHHPIRSRGPNGGHFGWRDWLFPVTNLASWAYVPLPLVYPPVRRGIVRSNQDTNGGRNRELQAMLERVFAATAPEPVAYASGHEHGQQVIESVAGRTALLVSGAATRTDPIGQLPGTIFSHSHLGLMKLDVTAAGRVHLEVLEPGRDGERTAVFAAWLDR